MSDRFASILQAIQTRKAIKIRLYLFSEEIKREIQFILENIFKKYSKEEDVYIVYTITKEIITNAIKANIKRAVFHNLNLDLKNETDYKQGLISMKKRLRSKYEEQNNETLKELGLFIDISFNYFENNLRIEVLNQVPLNKEEDLRIRKKFMMAKKYSSIADFYLEQMDEAEGAGIGIVMILMLLKNRKIHQKQFIIESDYKKYTKAHLTFPLVSI